MTKKKPAAKLKGVKPVAKGFNFFLGLACSVLFVFQIFVANSLSAKGHDIARLEREKEKLQNDQVFLSEALASLGSLERIRSEALREGMVEGAENYDYLVPPKVAYNP